MIELFTDLTWQLQVLALETIVSCTIGLVLAYRGFQRTRGTMLLMLAWNAVLFWLLLTGGNASWQHLLLGGWYLLDTFMVIAGGVERRKNEPESGYGVAVFTALLASALLALIVTG